MSLTPETLKRIRQIELKTRRLVQNSFAGAYHSTFKGRGMAFDTVRPYQPGDDIRDIDWNITARTDEAYIKQYAEERELTVMLMLDSSASCFFGTINRSKRDLAAEIGAVMALSATINNDKVGLLIFSDKVEHYLPPQKGRNHVLRLIRDLLAAQPSNVGTDLGFALRSVNRMLKQRAIVFLMSDFLAAPQEYSRDISVIARKHDVIALMLSDPRERQWVNVGLVHVQDAETGDQQLIDTSTQRWQKEFIAQSKRFYQQRDATLAQAGVDRIPLSVDADYVKALMKFFQGRGRRA